MSDTDIVTWLRSILHNDRSVELRCKEAADEIERLRQERDEARVLFCRHVGTTDDGAWDIMRVFGWDCFKEN